MIVLCLSCGAERYNKEAPCTCGRTGQAIVIRQSPHDPDGVRYRQEVSQWKEAIAARIATDADEQCRGKEAQP